MNVVEISFMKRKNLGNYEHEEIKLVAQVEEGEDSLQAMTKLKALTESALNGEKTQPVQEEVKDEKPVKKKVTKSTKKRTKKPVAELDDTSEEEVVEDTPEEVPEPPKKVGLAEVKQNLAAVWKNKGKPVAVDILKDFGVKRSEDLTEDQFEAVIAECEKVLK